VKKRENKVRLNLRIAAHLDRQMRALAGDGHGAIVDFIEEARADRLAKIKRQKATASRV
jgi:hypothetical protein